VSLDEVRAVWETNVFGVLAVTQAMLPLLREAPAARIVNVSSGAGSLTRKTNGEDRCSSIGCARKKDSRRRQLISIAEPSAPGQGNDGQNSI
jgi:NAD(P)-dependent dehydrogenase (short-subunit alcohol dehydrogenase family)